MISKTNSAMMVAASIVGQGALIISGIVAARVLGPSLRGELAILVLIPTITAQLTLIGLPSAITYYIGRDKGVSLETLSCLFRILAAQMSFAIAVLAAMLLFGQRWLPSAAPVLLVSVTIAGAFLIVQQYAYAILQGHNEFLQVATARLSPSVFYAIFAASVWALGAASFTSIALSWVGANVVSGAISGLYVRTCLKRHSRIPGLRATGDLLVFGKRAFFGSTTPIETFRVDQLLGAIFLSRSGMGLYVVAQALSGLPKILASNIGIVVFAGTARDNESTGVRARVRTAVLLIGAAIVLCGALLLLAPTLMKLFFGPEFADGAVVAQILLVGALFFAVRRFLTEYAKGLGDPSVSSVSELAALATALVLAGPFSVTWGVTGLAGAICTAQCIALLVALFVLNRRRSSEVRTRILND
jgi:O-antigen/teichoic acid export membrane protein